MHDFGRVSSIDLYGLGILIYLENIRCMGMARLGGIVGIWRLSSLSSVVATAAVANSMLSYSQSIARCVLASTVMTLVGLGILSLR
jgi:hypothetical protein